MAKTKITTTAEPSSLLEEPTKESEEKETKTTDKKKGKTKDCEDVSWKTYIEKVLKQVHPDSGSTENTKRQMNSIIDALAKIITQKAVSLTAYTNIITVNSIHIQNAIRIVFPGELAKHAVSEGTKAVTKYNISKESVKERMSSAARSGLIFPPKRADRYLRKFSQHSFRVSDTAPVYLAAVLEYVAAEILELAGNAARDMKKVQITSRHIFVAVENDPELSELFQRNNILIINGGVIPGVLPFFLRKEQDKKKLAKQRKQRRKNEGSKSTSRKHLPGTAALREVKNLQKETKLCMEKSPFEREVKRVWGLISDKQIRIGDDAMMTFQFYIEYTIISYIQKALLITASSGKQTLLDKHVITALRIMNLSRLTENSEVSGDTLRQIKTASLIKLTHKAGALRKSENVYPILRQIIVALILETLKDAQAVLMHKAVLSPKFFKQTLELRSTYIPCIKKKGGK